MFSDRIFSAAFFLSVTIHAICFVEIAPILHNPVEKKRGEDIEITYYTLSEKSEVRTSAVSERVGEKGFVPVVEISEKAVKSRKRKRRIKKKAAKAEKKISKQTIQKAQKESEEKQKKSEEKKKIPLTTNKELLDKPAFLTYYQTLREHIRKFAQGNYTRDIARNVEGDIYMTFTLLSTGEVKDVSFIDVGEEINGYLGSIAARSIKEAAPFPPFPESFKESEIPFNIIISFERE